MSMNTPNNDRALDWDDIIENDDGEFTLLPAGDYPFTVESFERGEFAGSDKMPPCKKAVVTLKVDGGKLGTTTLMENLYLHSRAEWKLCEFFTAIGLRKRGEPLKMPWQQVPGRRGMCTLGIRKYKGQNGTDKQTNQVAKFLEPQAPTPAASAPTTWQPGAF